MANVYVRSGAGGAGTGADWANAYTTLSAAFTAKAAGDNFWVAHDHAETQGSAMTNTSPGTAAAPCTVMCVSTAGSVPPVAADLATTATITTTGNFQLTIAGAFTYFYGIAFSAGSGAVNTNLTLVAIVSATMIFDSCKLIKAGTTGIASAISFSSVTATIPHTIIFNNTTVQFGATADSIRLQHGRFIWRNTASAIAGATLPTALFNFASFPTVVLLEGVDLSALGSGKTLVSASATGSEIVLKDCKLGASVTVSARQTSITGTKTSVVRSDSGDTHYRQEIVGHYSGDLTTETTIVRTGGASDGETVIAWKVVTTANSKWLEPFECFPITIWNTTLGSITVTIYGVWGGAGLPNNDDVWMDVEYFGTSGFPQANLATSNKASYLATNAALSTDSSTWGGGTTKFKMTATFTPAEIGPITIYVKMAAASSTFYIDPKAVVS